MKSILVKILQNQFLRGLLFGLVFSLVLALGSHFKASIELHAALIFLSLIFQNFIAIALGILWAVAETLSLISKENRQKITAYIFNSSIILILSFLFFSINPNSSVFLDAKEREDQWLQQNPPSAEVIALASDSSMTEAGKRMFYLSNPTMVATRDELNVLCGNNPEKGSTTLGCFIQRRERIYLLDIPDARLNGTMQMTASHEMLHIVFHQLPVSEKNILIGLFKLVSEGPLKKKLEDRMKVYVKNGNFDKWSEMHSILGTEFENLPPELEHHYSKYFVRRKNLVSLAKATDHEFDKRSKSMRAYDAQLAELKSKVVEQKKIVNKAQFVLKLLEEKIRNGHQGDSSLIASYKRALEINNSTVKDLNQSIAMYNSIVHKRNSVARETNEMAEVLDDSAVSASI